MLLLWIAVTTSLHAEYPRNTTDSRARVEGLILAELTVQGAKSWDVSWRVGHRTVRARHAMLTELTVAAAIVSLCLMMLTVRTDSYHPLLDRLRLLRGAKCRE